MKKLLLAIAMLVMIGISPVHAQDPASTSKAKTHMKKDGTPDKRYSENKAVKQTTKAPSGPTKRDGTADMRYKANKKVR